MLVFNGLSADEPHQRVPKRVWIVAVVVPERHLVEVRGKVAGVGFLARRQGGLAHQVQVDAAGGGASFSDGPND